MLNPAQLNKTNVYLLSQLKNALYFSVHFAYVRDKSTNSLLSDGSYQQLTIFTVWVSILEMKLGSSNGLLAVMTEEAGRMILLSQCIHTLLQV